MSHRLALPALLLALLTAFVFCGHVAAAGGAATLTGVVVDGTKGSALPAGVTVALHGTGQNHETTVDQGATADSAGHFTFSGVPVDPSVVYQVSASYAGAVYTAAVTAAPDGTLAPVTLTVYEPTTSDATIQIASANWVFESIDTDNQQIAVLETLDVVNAGDRTYVGDHRGDPGSDTPGLLPRTLRIVLPAGASGFVAEDGLNPAGILPVAGGYVDTAPVLPGHRQIAFTYRIAYADGGAEIRKSMPYPTATLRFLGPNAGLDLRSDVLKSAGTIDLQGRSFVVLAADNVPANTDVTVDMLGFPSTPVGRIDPTVLAAIGYVAIAIALVVGLYLGFRPRGRRGHDVATDRASLIVALADLDDRFASGKIETERYQSQRAETKRALVDLLLGETSAQS